jgi:hypothetical protein
MTQAAKDALAKRKAEVLAFRERRGQAAVETAERQAARPPREPRELTPEQEELAAIQRQRREAILDKAAFQDLMRRAKAWGMTPTALAAQTTQLGIAPGPYDWTRIRPDFTDREMELAYPYLLGGPEAAPDLYTALLGLRALDPEVIKAQAAPYAYTGMGAAQFPEVAEMIHQQAFGEPMGMISDPLMPKNLQQQAIRSKIDNLFSDTPDLTVNEILEDPGVAGLVAGNKTLLAYATQLATAKAEQAKQRVLEEWQKEHPWLPHLGD